MESSEIFCLAPPAAKFIITIDDVTLYFPIVQVLILLIFNELNLKSLKIRKSVFFSLSLDICCLWSGRKKVDHLLTLEGKRSFFKEFVRSYAI